ncbi:hypothetical protein [Marinactinospora rubrisoli]|uniref:Uncharacterized protein n=1 Tax=Marinactinospora rubrisoli TaxID=2715399 RepID=A0ABW2KR21_9ACTN
MTEAISPPKKAARSLMHWLHTHGVTPLPGPVTWAVTAIKGSSRHTVVLRADPDGLHWYHEWEPLRTEEDPDFERACPAGDEKDLARRIANVLAVKGPKTVA